MSYPPHPTLSSINSIRNSKTSLLEWLPKRNPYWFGMGRQAIFAALQALKLPKGSKVLVPAYQCPSALDPFVAFGVEPIFYDLDPNLRPDLERLESLIRHFKPKLLMVIHYFGFPIQRWKEIIELTSHCSLPLLEDCAHALFSKHKQILLGSWGDVSVFSLVKSLPVPSGGILVLKSDSKGSRTLNLTDGSNEWPGLLKLLLYELERFFPISVRTMIRSITIVDKQVRRRMETPPNGFDLCIPRTIGKWTCRIVERCHPERIVKKRRENYLAVLGVLKNDQSILKPIFPTLPNGVCPLGCPVLISAKRDDVLLRLWRRGIPARPIWDRLPTIIPEGKYPGSAYLRAHIIVLPVHQGLNNEQVRKITEITLKVANKVLSL